MPRGIRKKVIYDESNNAENNMTELSPAEVETNGPETKNGTIKTLVNVRKDPSTYSEVIEILGKGETVSIIGATDGFYRVKTRRNRIGYISSNFVEEG